MMRYRVPRIEGEGIWYYRIVLDRFPAGEIVLRSGYLGRVTDPRAADRGIPGRVNETERRMHLLEIHNRGVRNIL
jgi:hypothetical protein